MKKIIFLTLIALVLTACPVNKTASTTAHFDKHIINQLLDQWHKDVATFNYDAYFDKMTKDAVFVGTDASEVWTKSEFQSFSKPFFDKKQTWDFKPLQRNVYFNKQSGIAWFDETLSTWMGVCRGSGVVVLKNGKWKIQHYVLSVAIPNEDVKAIVDIKKERDSVYINSKKEFHKNKKDSLLR